MVPLFQRISLSASRKRKWQRRSERLSVAAMTSHFPHSYFWFVTEFSKEQRLLFVYYLLYYYLSDLRISGFGYHGTQLLYTVINVESSSPLNCREAWMTGGKNTNKFFRSGIWRQRNPSIKSGRSALTYWGYGCLSSAFLSVKLSHRFLKNKQKNEL